MRETGTVWQGNLVFLQLNGAFLGAKQTQGFPKGGFCEGGGGEISIIGVARTGCNN